MSEHRVKTTEPMVVAVREYRGPALGVGEAFEQVLSWADVYHLDQSGPLIGVYADVPADPPADVASPSGAVDEIRAEAWLPLPAGALSPVGDGSVQVRSLGPETVAVCLHRGYPDAVGEALAGLLHWVGEQGLARDSAVHRQVYLRTPKGRPGDWEIEVQLPVAMEPAKAGSSEPRQE